MLTYHGSTRVRSGFYWHLKGWNLVTLSREGGVLPGGPENRYLKVPAPLLLVLVPLMGGLYVVFLPFIGFAMLAAFLLKGALGAVGRAAGALNATLSPAWQPGEAYFAGKREGAEAPDSGTGTKEKEA